MKRKSLQKSLIGITSAAVIGAMSSGAMAAEKNHRLPRRIGIEPPSPAPTFI